MTLITSDFGLIFLQALFTLLSIRIIIFLPDLACAWVELNRHIRWMNPDSLVNRLQHDCLLLPLVRDSVLLKNFKNFVILGKFANRYKSIRVNFFELQLNVAIVVVIAKVEGDLSHQLLLDIV